MLVEGLLLSLAGAAIGLLLAYLGVRGISAWLPAGLPRVASIGLDLRVLFAAIAAAAVTGMLFGIVPALQSARPDLSTALKDGGRSATAGAGSQRLRGALVVAEVALAVMLLVGAGLFIGSFVRLMRIEPGFDYRNVMALNVGVRGSCRGKFDEAMKRQPAIRPADARGGQARPRRPDGRARVSGGLPLTGSWSRDKHRDPRARRVEGRRRCRSTAASSRRAICRLLRIPLLRGRYLQPTDTRDVASRSSSSTRRRRRRYWPGDDALGKRLKINEQGAGRSSAIVGDIRHLGPEPPPRQEGYIPVGAGRRSSARRW